MIAESTEQSPPSSAPPPTVEPTLAELMGRVARRVSFNLAMGTSAASVVLLALVLAFRPGQWRVALLLTAIASAGGWTMAEHERVDGVPGGSPSWRALQSVTGVLGIATIFAFLLSILSSALGLWIS
ncbi:MAG: hypothetical protein U0132_14730 [Gemmatimonadaceae bacterium]